MVHNNGAHTGTSNWIHTQDKYTWNIVSFLHVKITSPWAKPVWTTSRQHYPSGFNENAKIISSGVWYVMHSAHFGECGCCRHSDHWKDPRGPVLLVWRGLFRSKEIWRPFAYKIGRAKSQLSVSCMSTFPPCLLSWTVTHATKNAFQPWVGWVGVVIFIYTGNSLLPRWPFLIPTCNHHAKENYTMVIAHGRPGVWGGGHSKMHPINTAIFCQCIASPSTLPPSSLQANMTILSVMCKCHYLCGLKVQRVEVSGYKE